MNVKEHTFVKRKYNSTARDFLEYLCENPHENLPTIVEITEDFYVMEYISGTTLQNIIEEKVFDRSDAKKFMLQLLDAVEVLHKFRIVHRDIKPENIIITNEGALKLIDFDIARKIVDFKSRDTEILGTAGYAAPEQFGFTQTDERSDIYALGIVYNFMLTGKIPAEKPTDNKQITKIIQKCTRIDKSKRYKSLKQLRKDIAAEKFTSYNLFDIIPGFRTGNIFKMIFAISVYLTIPFGLFVITVQESPKTNFYDFTMFCMVVFVYLICDFLFFAIATNFLNILDRIKLPLKKAWTKKAVLLLTIYLLASTVTLAISPTVQSFLLGNPINATVSIYLYLLYSIISPFIFGML